MRFISMMVVGWSSMYWSSDGFSIYWSGNCFGVYWSWGWMYWVSRFFYNSVETVVVVGGVVNSSEGTIGFSNSVGTFNYITITDFVLSFVITSVSVLNSVVEFVFRVSLKHEKFGHFHYNLKAL